VPAELSLAVVLGTIWTLSKGMLDASDFVNKLRDAVVIGYKDGKQLSLRHRRVLRMDWALTMAGTVLFPLVYAVLLGALARHFEGAANLAKFHGLVSVLSAVPVIGSLLFVACGVIDWRLMEATLQEAEHETAAAAATVKISAGASVKDAQRTDC
jgi:hypothetical protein